MARRKADWMLANGRPVIFPEFGGTKYVDDWDETFDEWEQAWVQNFMSFADGNGYSGYLAWLWGSSRGGQNAAWNIIYDWNGGLTTYGTFLKNYYLVHQGTSPNGESP